jgi:hypothetical protein
MWRWFLRVFPRRCDYVSDQWLAAHTYEATKVGRDQVAIHWPIRKLANEQAQFQTAKLSKRA